MGTLLRASVIGFLWLSSSVATATEKEHSPPAASETEEWEVYLMPGLSYVYYQPRDEGQYGQFHGLAIEFLLKSWGHQNDRVGPSHGRTGFKLELLQPTRAQQSDAVAYAAFFDLSFERNPQRKFLIPFFGFDVGEIFQREFERQLHLTPRLGLHVWAQRNLFVTLAAGYRVVPSRIEDANGFYGHAGLNFTMW